MLRGWCGPEHYHRGLGGRGREKRKGVLGRKRRDSQPLWGGGERGSRGEGEQRRPSGEGQEPRLQGGWGPPRQGLSGYLGAPQGTLSWAGSTSVGFTQAETLDGTFLYLGRVSGLLEHW